MKIIFRTDASLQIGTGHVMRCLTLANALTQTGAECVFICREHPGNPISYLHEKGYAVYALPVSRCHCGLDNSLAHANLLGSSQKEDAEQCRPLIEKIFPDWLIVDHYALDDRWESMLRPYSNKIMVIDDLADRRHDCVLLIDQTYGRTATDYSCWVPDNCQLLCGSQYALLRPEFAQWRSHSLDRRKIPELNRLLITFGGVDNDNVTGLVLQVLQQSPLPNHCEVTVVMGSAAPWLDFIRKLAQSLPWHTSVEVAVDNMAQLMAKSDLSIGAAGATSWERCCLGLPTIMLVLADNQRLIAEQLTKAGAVIPMELKCTKQHLPQIIRELSAQQLKKTSKAASTITCGRGIDKIIKFINM